ncbi:MAG TPA: M23 family metallopeptidase [Pirellulales bacterium]|nr:M23 family metallopeptidase [Pirellulales bacterium]
MSSACVAIAYRFVRRMRGETAENVVLVLLRAAFFGLLVWCFSLCAWLALEISLGGRLSLLVEASVGSIAGGLAGQAAYWFGHRRPQLWAECCCKIALGVSAMAMLLFATMFFLFTGPHDLDRYPLATSSPYRLPWPGGVTRLCIQGSRAIVSHRDWEEFAYDFARQVGSDVCAARGGTVAYVDVTHDGNGRNTENDLITVDQGDGRLGCYLHLRQGESYVQPGQRVHQGDVIAASGNIGLSMLPHLHFNVIDEVHRLVPVTFADVDSDSGIPRMFKRYTSGNSVP